MSAADRLRALAAEATPGPWVIDGTDTHVGGITMGDPDSERHDFIETDGGYYGPRVENARLIALAPDLAAWAADAADTMREILSSPTGGGWQCHDLLARLDRIMGEKPGDDGVRELPIRRRRAPDDDGRTIPACRRHGYHMIGLDGRCITCGAPEGDTP